MARHPDLVPGAAYHAVLVDQKGAAVDAHVFAAVHALLDPHAIALAHLAVLVGGENERQAVLFLELVVRGDRIARHPDHRRAGLAVIGEGIAKAAGFRGAARGVVLRVEIQHHRLAAQLGQADAAVAVGGHGEIGGLVADRDAHRAASPVAGCGACAARRAGRAISRSYQARTRAQARTISASSRAKSTAPAQRARVAPAGPARSAGPGTPSYSSASRARRWRSKASASLSSRTPCGGRAPAAPSAARAEPVSRRNTSGARAASRSIRYWVMNSRSTRPPRRFRKSQDEGRGMFSAMRRRIAATSATRRRGSRGWRKASPTAAPIRSRSASSPAIGRARVSAICSQVQAASR